eukprot:238069-Rhodomonas_salina.1
MDLERPGWTAESSRSERRGTHMISTDQKPKQSKRFLNRLGHNKMVVSLLPFRSNRKGRNRLL